MTDGSVARTMSTACVVEIDGMKHRKQKGKEIRSGTQLITQMPFFQKTNAGGFRDCFSAAF